MIEELFTFISIFVIWGVVIQFMINTIKKVNRDLQNSADAVDDL